MQIEEEAHIVDIKSATFGQIIDLTSNHESDLGCDSKKSWVTIGDIDHLAQILMLFFFFFWSVYS